MYVHTFCNIRRMIFPLRVLHSPGVMTISLGTANAPTRVLTSYRISVLRSGYFVTLSLRVTKQHSACPLILSCTPTTAASFTCLCLLIALSSCARDKWLVLLLLFETEIAASFKQQIVNPAHTHDWGRVRPSSLLCHLPLLSQFCVQKC